MHSAVASGTVDEAVLEHGTQEMGWIKQRTQNRRVGHVFEAACQTSSAKDKKALVFVVCSDQVGAAVLRRKILDGRQVIGVQ